MKILDCTLRDGGYYNEWDFSPHIVESYLKAVSEANIDYVELGLRNFPQERFLGAFAYTTEDYLNTIDLPDGPTYGVMIDARTVLESGKLIDEVIEYLFCPASNSKIGMVRIAAHFYEVEDSVGIARRLKELGYLVGLNLMQAGGKATTLLEDNARLIDKWGCVDVLYFADSFGNMDADEVDRIVGALKRGWSREIGIHTHDNMGLGLSNTIAAKNAGVSWLDVTVAGMGRGAGNTQTERLLATLNLNHGYSPSPINELAIRYFEPMQRKYGWGCNFLYFLGAKNNIHPTYIQKLLSDSRYTKDEVIGAIDYLREARGASSFQGSVYDAALSFSSRQDDVTGSDELIGHFDGKNLLIIANSPNCQKYAKALESYIKKYKPTVLSINISTVIHEELIDYYIVSHNSKIITDLNSYGALKKPIILPKCRFSDSELEALKESHIIDYGLILRKNVLNANGFYTEVPFNITAAYALGMLLESDVSSITIAGFDGYESDDLRQQEMVMIFDLYKKQKKAASLTAITPTTYPVSKGSLFAPIV